jgi:hypothetical protein
MIASHSTRGRGTRCRVRVLMLAWFARFDQCLPPAVRQPGLR